MTHAHRKTETPGALDAAQNNSAAVSVVSGAGFGFRVHLYVAGNHGGYYRHDTEAEAVADMERRRRDYGILHCGYVLERPKPRCSACEAYAGLMSGLGMWEDVPDCDHLPNSVIRLQRVQPLRWGFLSWRNF